MILPAGLPNIQIGGQSLSGQLASITIPETNIATTGGAFSMWSGGGAVGDAAYYPFYKNGSIYQVTTGKTCVMELAIYICTSSTNQTCQLVSASASFARAAGSISGGIYQSGLASVYMLGSGPTQGVPGIIPVLYTFPALSYPGVQFSNAGNQVQNLFAICKEI